MKPDFRRFSLRLALTINVIVPLLVAVSVASYFGLRILEDLTEKRMKEDIQLVARAIRLPVQYSLEKERFGSIEQTLQFVFHIGRVYGAYVYDSGGKCIASAGAVEPEKQKKYRREVTKRGDDIGQYEKIRGQQVYSYFVPLLGDSGKNNGLLQISRKKSDFAKYRSWLRERVSLILVATGLFVTGFVLLGFHYAAGRYFAKLSHSMARVQKGERSHRARLKGPKEIFALSRSLNNMLDSMDRSENEIAARREAQQQLENKLRESEKMAAIGQLAAGVAHELGSPLSLIDGKAQRCLRDSNISTSHKNSLQDIRDQIRRMNEIVRQLLDFGKGSMRQKRWYRAVDLAESAISTVQNEVGESVQILMDDPKDDISVYIDPLRFEQVLINLMRNAAQAGENIRIRLSWEKTPDNEIVFCVEDNGPGIADEIRPRIFEPFFSTHNSSSNTGLGLPVVHGIVREHGGTIEVFNRKTGGAVFRIVLPLETGKQQSNQGEGNV